METNPMLKEIGQTRERLMAEASNDLGCFFAMIRDREAAAQARGVVFVPAPTRRAAAVREETPPYAFPGKEAAP